MSSLLEQLKAQQRRQRAKRAVKVRSPGSSKKRIAKLRAKGHKVVRRTLPDGTVVVLRSKKTTKKRTAKKTKTAKRTKSRGERLRATLRGYYKRGELGKASKLRARMKKAGLSTNIGTK